MIEKIIFDYLNEKLTTPAYMEKPETEVDEYILIEKAGGSAENFIKTARIIVQSYSNSLYNAALLNETVKETMTDIIILDDVSKCSLNGDYNYTDTTKKQYRYQAVFDIVYL